ncbi:nucleotidyltransferase family protein [Agrobacterium pusense]|uniref:nucleotidyltransferase family protein n=1 Tax=Agrobacterium pusense TaxID=648995 RepID=UPI003FD69768
MLPTHRDSVEYHVERIALIVLGAGFSSRFGELDKLGADVGGLPLSHHVLNAVQTFTWKSKILVCQGSPAWMRAYADAGFMLAVNERPERGMLSSLWAGLDLLKDETHVLVCLADMPFVPVEHFARLLSTMKKAGKPAVACKAEDYCGPPAIFSVEALKQLPHLGEGGARALLTNALFVECSRDELFDVDTEEDQKTAVSLAALPPHRKGRDDHDG